MTEKTQLLAYAPTIVLVVTVVIATVYDASTRRIPNILVATALAYALLLAVAIDGLSGIATSLAGLGVGMAILLPLYALRVTGAGDVKLLGAVGALVGPQGALITGLWTFFAGAFLALAWVAWQHVKSPIVTYLNLHLGGRVDGNAVSGSQFEISTRGGVPYAPAIAVGALIAAWQQGWLFPTGSV